jgi:hypothetical protein
MPVSVGADRRYRIRRLGAKTLSANTKDHVYGALTGYLCNQISPAPRVRPATHFYARADCCDTERFCGSFYTKPNVEHVLRRGRQVNVNFEATVFDSSLHEALSCGAVERVGVYVLSDQPSGRSPMAHRFGGSASAVFWYIQLPQTVQFQLLLIFVMLAGGPYALAPEGARSPCGGTLDGFPTSARQASQGRMSVSKEPVREILA